MELCSPCPLSDQKTATSEAEKHLNFDPVPSPQLQNKIKQYISPYNNTEVVTKFMNFNEKNEESTSHVSQGQWKKILNVISQDKHSMRSMLKNINQQFYSEVDKMAKVLQDSSTKEIRKRVKFANSKRGISRRGSSSKSIFFSPPNKSTSKRLSMPYLFSKHSNKQANSHIPRLSITSQTISGMRDSKQRSISPTPTAAGRDTNK